MSTIEKHLHEHFANVDDSEDPEVATEASGANVISIPDRSLPQHLLPSFAKVNSVVPGSPAEQAGLEPADEIRVFGYVTRENHDNLKKVGECVQGNEGVCSPAGLWSRCFGPLPGPLLTLRLI